MDESRRRSREGSVKEARTERQSRPRDYWGSNCMNKQKDGMTKSKADWLTQFHGDGWYVRSVGAFDLSCKDTLLFNVSLFSWWIYAQCILSRNKSVFELERDLLTIYHSHKLSVKYDMHYSTSPLRVCVEILKCSSFFFSEFQQHFKQFTQALAVKLSAAVFKGLCCRWKGCLPDVSAGSTPFDLINQK